MNLREDKRWAYGAFSFMRDAIGQRPFLMYAPVQTDKTAESANEVFKEATAVVGARPLTEQEVDKIKDSNVRGLPGSFETSSEVLGAMTEIVQYGRPDDYVQTLKARTEAIRQPDAEQALKEIIKPSALTWVIVGDLKKIEQPVRALKLGEIQVIDGDGKAVPSK
jgi:predicted Zn-dependent peptidase